MKMSELIEGAVEDLEKDLRNPYSYDAIDHMMTTIAKKHGVSPKKLHDLFVEKHGEIPDDWAKKLDEAWSAKYKRSINCANPKGFSQRAHCQGRKKNEDLDETIRKQGSKYVIYSKDGDKKLGTYDSKKAATKRLGQIEYFKHHESVDENFADGRNPQDKGDAKRHGVPTKASVSTLRKVAKQGGRKGQLAHWMANMKAGKAKKK